MYKLRIILAIVLLIGITACSNLSEKDLTDMKSHNQIVRIEAIRKIAKEDKSFCVFLSRLFSRKVEKKAVAILLKTLENEQESEEIQLNILKALGDLGRRIHVPITPIIKKLNDENPKIRLQAVESLGKIKDTKAVPALLDILDSEPDKSHILWSLGEIGDKRAIPALNMILASEDIYLQYNARKALKKIR